jgi:hypothetical protein
VLYFFNKCCMIMTRVGRCRFFQHFLVGVMIPFGKDAEALPRECSYKIIFPYTKFILFTDFVQVCDVCNRTG